MYVTVGVGEGVPVGVVVREVTVGVRDPGLGRRDREAVGLALVELEAVTVRGREEVSDGVGVPVGDRECETVTVAENEALSLADGMDGVWVQERGEGVGVKDGELPVGVGEGVWDRVAGGE